jgi:hypothetical protein
VRDFEIPEDISCVNIDPDTGKRAAEWTDKPLLECFKEGTEPGSPTEEHIASTPRVVDYGAASEPGDPVAPPATDPDAESDDFRDRRPPSGGDPRWPSERDPEAPTADRWSSPRVPPVPGRYPYGPPPEPYAGSAPGGAYRPPGGGEPPPGAAYGPPDRAEQRPGAAYRPPGSAYRPGVPYEPEDNRPPGSPYRPPGSPYRPSAEEVTPPRPDRPPSDERLWGTAPIPPPPPPADDAIRWSPSMARPPRD